MTLDTYDDQPRAHVERRAWRRNYVQQRERAETAERERNQLAAALRDVLMDGVQECTPYVEPCECSTARARRLLKAVGVEPPRDSGVRA